MFQLWPVVVCKLNKCSDTNMYIWVIAEMSQFGRNWISGITRDVKQVNAKVIWEMVLFSYCADEMTGCFTHAKYLSDVNDFIHTQEIFLDVQKNGMTWPLIKVLWQKMKAQLVNINLTFCAFSILFFATFEILDMAFCCGDCPLLDCFGTTCSHSLKKETAGLWRHDCSLTFSFALLCGEFILLLIFFY